MTTPTTTQVQRPPPEVAEYYRRLARGANGRQRTMLGTCPHCRGNVVRAVLPPNAEPHAQCLHCGRDLCCPPISVEDLLK